MVDTKELMALIDKAEAKGASVNVFRHPDGSIKSVQVLGLKNCGHHPMSVIGAAERLREIV